MDNRKKLLACALNLFSARGYDAVGVQEVVDAAGVTKPTLYHYFGNKRGLLESLLAENFQELYMKLRSEADYRGDLPLTLNRVATVYFRFAERNPVYYRMQLSLWFAPPESQGLEVVARLNEKQQDLLEHLFICAAKDHGNMKGRHQSYAATFLGMINTYIALALNGYVVLDRELTHRAVHQFMHGIFS